MTNLFSAKRAKYVFLLSVFVASTLISPAQAIPDEIFYSGNDILFYDPDSCKPNADGQGSPAQVIAGDNLKTILLYFTQSKGLSLAQAAGIAGNIKQESGFDPAIIQGGRKAPDNYKPVNGVGFGLVQWTFTGRQQPLVDLAKGPPKRSITDITLQLDNIWRELSGPYKHTLEALKGTNDPVQAAIIVHGPPYPGYEASADSASFVRRVRGGNAQTYYDQFKGQIADGEGSSTGGGTTNPESSGSGCATAGESEFSADGFVIYDQCDSRWGSVAYGTSGKTSCTSGCGPTAMAMAITALKGESVLPSDTVAYASQRGMYVDGVGSSWVLPSVIGEHWNVTASKISMTVESINKTLESGGLVILSGSNVNPFTSAGHYILIRGVTDDGKWKIADSNGAKGKENSQQRWDPRTILVNANAGSTYAITK
jgi:hypothetical protein